MADVKTSITEATKSIGDGASIFIVLGTLGELLPPIAALLTIVWTVIRICETKTVRKWLKFK